MNGMQSMRKVPMWAQDGTGAIDSSKIKKAGAALATVVALAIAAIALTYLQASGVNWIGAVKTAVTAGGSELAKLAGRTITLGSSTLTYGQIAGILAGGIGAIGLGAYVHKKIGILPTSCFRAPSMDTL